MDEQTHSTKKYFQQSANKTTNFFDDLSSSTLVKNVAGTGSSCDLLNEDLENIDTNRPTEFLSKHQSEASVRASNNDAIMPSVSLYDKEDESKTEKLSRPNISEEPVVCRIFSSLQIEPSKTEETKTQPGSSFFDMLSSPVVSRDIYSHVSLDETGVGFSLPDSGVMTSGRLCLSRCIVVQL